jgi:arylsulfatase A-like enzyme
MRRRRLLRAAGSVAAVLSLAAAWVLWRESPRPEPPPGAPSILLVTLDTLRADRLGAYGSTAGLTPALDRLAEEGIVFERAFTTMPVTVPAHAAMLFGTWPGVLGTTNNSTRITNVRVPYLPALLQRTGYVTAAVLGSEHLGRALEDFPGFDWFDVPRDHRTADEVLDRARRWLQKIGDRRFFLWVHLWDPHWPYFPHPGFVSKRPAELPADFELRRGFLPSPAYYTADRARAVIALYDNEVAFLDRHLGIFLEELRGSRRSEKVLVIVTADHGESLDERMATDAYAFDHGEFLDDPQIRVPLIVVPPGGAGSPHREPEPVSHVDLAPTVFQTLGLAPPPDWVGQSLLSPRRTDPGPGGRAVFFARRTFREPPRPFLGKRRFGLHWVRYKLLLDLDDGETVLLKEGDDLHDLGRAEPQVRERLRERLVAWIEASGVAIPYRSEPLPPDQVERLRSLGYLP